MNFKELKKSCEITFEEGLIPKETCGVLELFLDNLIRDDKAAKATKIVAKDGVLRQIHLQGIEASPTQHWCLFERIAAAEASKLAYYNKRSKPPSDSFSPGKWPNKPSLR